MFKSFIALFITFFAFISAEEVITLTSANFKKELEANPFILVEFYAPWCGHCKKLAPEYEKAAAAAKELDPKVVLAKVDATVENELASEFGVKGFPTLKWFVNGKVAEYTGGRTEDTILTWLKKKTGPPAQVLADVAALEKFKEEADAVTVGFFKDEAEAKAYLEHAMSDDDTPYAVCYEKCDEIKKAAGAGENDKVVVLQKFDEGKAIFSGDIASAEAIGEFVAGNLLPLIVPFKQEFAPKIFGGKVKVQFVTFVDSLESDASKELVEKLKPVARKFQGKIIHVMIEKKDERIFGFFGVKPDEVPTARIVNMGSAGARKYKFTEKEITTETAEKFTQDYFDGKIPMDLKSEDVVPESEQGPVRVVVGKDFEEVVNQPGKDVLVEFYAPWCGHCKKLEPEYTALGEHFKDNENIVIAKCDATANEVERVQVSGFPTIKFFPADSTEIVDYNGGRDKDGLIKWLNENAKTLK